MMANIHKRGLGNALALLLDAIAEEGRSTKESIPLEQHLRLLRNGQAGVYRDEIIASRLMKQLSARFGTRGKTQKHVFLQAFEKELKGGSSSETEYLRSVGKDKPFYNDEKDVDDNRDDDELLSAPRSPVQTEQEPKTMADLMSMRNGHLGPIIERPAAMVRYSVFLHKLDRQLQHQIHRLNCQAPVLETKWLFEEIKPNKYDESLTFYEAMSVRDMLEEPEEILMRRHKLYRRAFSALVLHSEALRPVLRQIKKTYDHVLFVRERELKETIIMKQNIEKYKKNLDLRNVNVKFEASQQLEDVQHQSVILLRHIAKQESAIRQMNEVLNRLELNLSDEHDGRRDSEDQEKLLIIEINDYRKKLGMEPRPTDYNSDISLEKINGLNVPDLPTAEEENIDMEKAEKKTDEAIPRDLSITVDDVLILRKALEIAMKDLKEADERMETMEKENKDVTPRHELLVLKQLMIDLEADHEKRKNAYEDLSSQVQGLHDQIESLTQDKARLTEKVTELRTNATPRPSWEYLGEYIDGGIRRWKILYEEKSSKENAEKLFLELTMKKLADSLKAEEEASTLPEEQTEEF